MERRSLENKALRELVDSLKEYITARDSLWGLGFFDRIFRFSRCVDMLNHYDKARERVRSAIRDVKDSGGTTAQENQVKSETAEEGAAEKTAATSGRNLLSMEEFEMLLGRPSILKKLPPRQRDPRSGSGGHPAGPSLLPRGDTGRAQ